MNKKLDTMKIKGNDYVTVNSRLIYFRENYKDYSLESEIVSVKDGICIIKAVVKDAEGNIKATGHAYEKEGSSNVNKTSYIENCETSAWGRALGCLGIGIEGSVASYDEVENAILQQENPQPVLPKLSTDKGSITGLQTAAMSAYTDASEDNFHMLIEQLEKKEIEKKDLSESQANWFLMKWGTVNG
jgi:hypothetical protein